jgi:Tol biopolymer transport system component
MTTTDTTRTVKNTNYHSFYLRAVVVMLVGLAVAMSLLVEQARPAQAAYPGANGKIVFASDRTTGTGVDNPTGDYEIFTMNLDATEITQLTFNTALDYSPSISDDGSVVVFTSDRDGNREIYVMYANGTDQRRLTNNTVLDDHPTNSPNGFTVAYEGFRNNNSEIISQTGGVETNLTNNTANDTQPTFSPDGTKIAFTSLRDGNAEIYTMNSNGLGVPTNLTKHNSTDWQPAFSPDGKQITFVSSRYGTFDVFVMNSDGSGWVQRTSGGGNFQPDWGPKP